MDRYVRGVSNGAERGPRVRAFVMGENVWREGDTLPLAGTKPMSLYLAPGGQLRERPPASASADAARATFVSDPGESPSWTRTAPPRARATIAC